jgi:hypothetical protein
VDEQRTQSNEPKPRHPQELIEDFEPEAVTAIEDLEPDTEAAEGVKGGAGLPYEQVQYQYSRLN